MISPMARTIPLLVGLLALLLIAPVAGAASRSQIIHDCEDDSRLSGSYTPKELRDARNNLPSDKDAYSDCRDVLGAALAASARTRSPTGGGGAGAGAGSTGSAGTSGPGATTALPPAPPLDIAPGAAPVAPTEPEKQALRAARRVAPAVDVRGRRVVPGLRGVAGQAASTTFPVSLLVVLVLLAVTFVLAAVPFVRRRVLGRRTA